jgi:hypothetical protein
MAGLIDTNLIRPELAGSFAAGYRGAEQARQQTQQNQQQFEMNQMKMRQLQEDRAALTDLQSKLRAAGQSDDPNMFFRALIQTGNPDYMSKGYEGLQRYKDLVAYEREFGGGAPANAMAAPAASMAAPAAAAPAPEGELVAAPIRPIPLPVTARAAADEPAPVGETDRAYLQRQFGMPGGAAPTPAPTNALAPAAAVAPVTNAMAAATPDVNALMRRYSLASRAGSPDAAVILKQVEAALKADKMSLSDRFVPVGNLVFDRQTEKYITPTEAQLAMTRAQQQPRAPIAVLQNGRPVYVSPEQAVGQTPFTPASVQVLGMGPQREPAAAAGQKAPAGYRFTPGGDLEPIPGGPASPGLSPKDIQKREAAFPQAKQAVSTVRNTMSVIKQTIDRLLENEAGLNGVTGLIGGITPGVTDAARQAVADLDQLKNLAFIQGITELRNASKTGAGVGNVSNKEGDRFENLKASLARSQSLDSMKNALKRLRDQADITDTTIQDAFDETYEYRAQRGAGGGNAPAAKQMSPQDKQALDWANSNPKDPRAAQIKARLGVQ